LGAKHEASAPKRFAFVSKKSVLGQKSLHWQRHPVRGFKTTRVCAQPTYFCGFHFEFCCKPTAFGAKQPGFVENIKPFAGNLKIFGRAIQRGERFEAGL